MLLDLARAEEEAPWLTSPEVLESLVQALRPNWSTASSWSSVDLWHVTSVCAAADQLVTRAAPACCDLLYQVLVGPAQLVVESPTSGPPRFLGAKLTALNVLRDQLGPADAPLLLRLLDDGREPDRVRDAIGERLLWLDGVGHAPDVARAMVTYGSKLLEAPGHLLRTEVRAAMVPALIAALCGLVPGVSAAAADVLSRLGLVAVPALVEVMRGSAPRSVRRRAGQALRRISPVDYAQVAELVDALDRALSPAEAPTADPTRGLSPSEEL
ncbi:MAG: hypothetical protein HZB16_15105 [Armatimonadetes bacterium]|nr:hypothetical protein [Armatimonadota bacterium]